MIEFSSTGYLWIKALHIVSVISWMAGMLYLPRLFVYHADAKPGSDAAEAFKVMERRLLRVIMTPAMIATLIFGVMLLIHLGPGAWKSGWWHAKMLAVIAMFAIHMGLARWRREFAENRNRHTPRFYRIVNEIPAVLMVAIVIMVVVKPF